MGSRAEFVSRKTLVVGQGVGRERIIRKNWRKETYSRAIAKVAQEYCRIFEDRRRS
jgi:hypothetical protein